MSERSRIEAPFSRPQAVQVPAVPTWEFQVHEFQSGADLAGAGDLLNDLGGAGWECFAVVQSSTVLAPGGLVVLFRRVSGLHLVGQVGA